METSPPFEIDPQIDRRVDELIASASEHGRAFDLPGLLADLETTIERDGVRGLDPPNPDYWAAVLTAVKRRAGLPV